MQYIPIEPLRLVGVGGRSMAGMIGPSLAGWTLEVLSDDVDLAWRRTFHLPALLCLAGATVFERFASGNRTFE
jgi:hypothetical protein